MMSATDSVTPIDDDYVDRCQVCGVLGMLLCADCRVAQQCEDEGEAGA